MAPLLERSPFGPLRYLGAELGASRYDFWLDSIGDFLASGSSLALVAMRGGQTEGLVVGGENDWESRVLGHRTGVVHHLLGEPRSPRRNEILEQLVAAAVNWAGGRDIRLLTCRMPADDLPAIHALERRGFLLMDTLVDCCFDARRVPFSQVSPPGPPADVSLRLARPDDVEELASVARASFRSHFGRYHADERIGPALATRVYEEWARSAASGYADWICVAEAGGRIAGYSVWKRPSARERELRVRVGHYSISGIHPAFSGRGLFTALTYEGMKLLQGVSDVVEGPTHVSNHGVQRGYSRLGWRVGVDARLGFHLWLDRTAG